MGVPLFGETLDPNYSGKEGSQIGGPYKKNYMIWGSIWGSRYLGKP